MYEARSWGGGGGGGGENRPIKSGQGAKRPICH